MKKFFLWLFDIFKTLFFVALIVIPLRYFVFQPFLVSGASMEPNFSEGEYVLVDEITYRFREPKRGEVIIFKSPQNSYFFIKRIIGLPGERIKIKEGKIWIYNLDWPNGKIVNEPYIQEATTGNLDLELKKNKYFVLGDNRLFSSDSRSWGPIPRKNIIGKVWISLSFKKGLEIFKLPQYQNL